MIQDNIPPYCCSSPVFSITMISRHAILFLLAQLPLVVLCFCLKLYCVAHNKKQRLHTPANRLGSFIYKGGGAKQITSVDNHTQNMAYLYNFIQPRLNLCMVLNNMLHKFSKAHDLHISDVIS